MKLNICLLRLVLVFFLFSELSLCAQTLESWRIPVDGNGFFAPEKSEQTDETPRWVSTSDRYLIFFKADRDCQVDLSLKLTVPTGKSIFSLSTGKKKFKFTVEGRELQEFNVGKVNLKAGYSKVEVAGLKCEGDVFAVLSELVVKSSTPGLVLNFVKDNTDNRFYWGRRGPSVHLSYEMPKDVDIEWFYNEVFVPPGEDPVGSYFMANGFGEGYFGIQVNGTAERRILFSVWSPFKTDRPGDIPDAEKIVLLAKGDGVHTGEFGNEGSGGQSYLKFPWKSGVSYGFLTKATPDGKGNTTYSSWFFAPEVGKWKLIASFQRPKTDHYLTRLHSFLENFDDKNGYFGRKAFYSNQWCRDKSGSWIPLKQAKFIGDDIAKRGYRMDYAGGVEEGRFYLRNGGFFDGLVPLNTVFSKEVSKGNPPLIDVGILPGN